MSEPQHMTALSRANAVRLGRAAWRRELRDEPMLVGQAQVAAVLREHAYNVESQALDMAERLPVVEFIGWIRWRSDAYARRLALQLGLARVAQHYGLRVDQLTVHEAMALADALDPTTVTNQEA